MSNAHRVALAWTILSFLVAGVWWLLGWLSKRDYLPNEKDEELEDDLQ